MKRKHCPFCGSPTIRTTAHCSKLWAGKDPQLTMVEHMCGSREITNKYHEDTCLIMPCPHKAIKGAKR